MATKGQVFLASKEKRLSLLEDVELMVSAGESVDQMIKRLGKSPGALARMMARVDRPDLARMFERERNRLRWLADKEQRDREDPTRSQAVRDRRSYRESRRHGSASPHSD